MLRLVLPYRVPFVLGHDVAGVVVRVGSAVQSFRPGDKCSHDPATTTSARSPNSSPYPRTTSPSSRRRSRWNRQLRLPLVALTAWQALVEKANVRPGQRVLVHAGSGGVGTIAVELAKHLGAHVATTAGTANVQWVKALGADVVIDYRKDDFAALLRDYDVVFDTQVGRTLHKSLSVLKVGGIAIGIAGPPDPEVAKEMGANLLLRLTTEIVSTPTRLLARRRQVRYSFLVMRSNGEQLSKVAALVDAGVITPVPDQVFPFPSTNEAMNYVAGGRAKGKVVITVGSPPDTGTGLQVSTHAHQGGERSESRA